MLAVPDPWHLALLTLAAHRLWHLAALDTILEPLRDKAYGVNTYPNPADTEPIVTVTRPNLDDFIGCAWCFGLWITLALWLTWQAWPHPTLIAATPLAISSILGLLSKLS